MNLNVLTVDMIYFGLIAVLSAFLVGKPSKPLTGLAPVMSGLMFVVNMLAVVGVLPR